MDEIVDKAIFYFWTAQTLSLLIPSTTTPLLILSKLFERAIEPIPLIINSLNLFCFSSSPNRCLVVELYNPGVERR